VEKTQRPFLGDYGPFHMSLQKPILGSPNQFKPNYVFPIY